MNVLLIENHEQFRDLVKEFLEGMGGVVTEVASPTLALGIPRERFGFDLIVTDMDFADIDGLSFIERIERTTRPQRVMFMSGTDHEKRIQEKCAEHPETVWEFIRKPFSKRAFQVKMTSLLARNP